jgi:hypothetical protein
MCENEDHCSQFDYISDMLLNFYSVVIVWANRSGSKTYFLALINWLKSLWNKLMDIVILGGSGEQSSRAYEAMADYWSIGANNGRCYLEERYVKGQRLIEKVRLKNGAKIGILTASEKSTRGPHPNTTALDEVDVMDDNILQIALSQPMSKNGIPACLQISSTNHVMGGNMDEQLERASKNPDARIYRWCIWECLEACTDYSCSTCPLSPYCPGKQMKEATGYYTIKDFLTKLQTLSLFSIETEWFCNKIGHPDLVYGHEIQEHHFIDVHFSPDRMVYLSIDWGGTDAFSIGVWQDFRNTALNAWARVDEIFEENTSNPKVIEICKKRAWWNYIKECVYDPSRSDLRKEWEEAKPEGIRMIAADNTIDVGIEKVKGALSPVIGRPMFYIAKHCKASRREYFSYKLNKKGKPIDKNNHTQDETRYFVLHYINPIQKKSSKPAEIYKSELYEKMSF